MTATEHAAEIRATLKQRHRWTPRHVSVRAEYFSLGSSITVTVKDPSIPLPTVKAIARGAEHIRRCEYPGEILSGGNRYVAVRYSPEAQEIIGRRAVNDPRGAYLVWDTTGQRHVGPVFYPAGTGYVLTAGETMFFITSCTGVPTFYADITLYCVP
jgi:hypothetical protein